MKKNSLIILFALTIFLFFPNQGFSEDASATGTPEQKKPSEADIARKTAEELAKSANELDQTIQNISVKDVKQESTTLKSAGADTTKIDGSIGTLEGNITKIQTTSKEIKDKADKLNKHHEDKKPDYKSPYFLLTGGVVSLSPYKIEKKTSDTGAVTFELAPTDGADTTYFVDANFKFRRAWLGDYNKHADSWWQILYSRWSGAVRFGITGADKDPTTSVAAGTGNAYAEINTGPDIPIIQDWKKDDPFISIGFPDLVFGVTTDKGNQTIHQYYGVGALLTFGFPRTREDADKNKMIEVLFGLYPYAKIDVPEFEDGTSLVISERRADAMPKFITKSALMTRLEAHLPFSEHGYITVYGNFTTFKKDKRLSDPWTLGIGYSIPIENIKDSITALLNGK